MKKIIFGFILVLVFSSCSDGPFTGYVVGKEHTREHMSNENVQTESVCSITAPTPTLTYAYIPVHVASHPKSHKVNESYVLYVANKHTLRQFNVSQKIFNQYHCGDQITLK